MAFLNISDKQRIAEAIRQAESKTSSELVTVIARASDDYLYIPLLWAALIALAVPGLIILFAFGLEFGKLYKLMVVFIGFEFEFGRLYMIQIMSFVVLALLFRWPPLMMRLIPKAVKRRRASRVAHQQFFEQNLHHTRERTGVMLFVSVAEHYVEIIADKGINDVVEEGVWDEVIAEFVQHVKARQVAEGFLAAVTACGKILAKHFPATHDNPDELPNHLIEI